MFNKGLILVFLNFTSNWTLEVAQLELQVRRAGSFVARLNPAVCGTCKYSTTHLSSIFRANGAPKDGHISTK